MRVGITGHRGLPKPVADKVQAELDAVVGQFDPAELAGVSCLADGPDSWFAQTVLDHGGRLEVVVPAEEYRNGLPEEHHPTYDALFSKASEVHRTGLDASTADAHMVGSEVLVGLIDELIAVWDGKPARGLGGTADVVAYVRRTGVPVRVVWPSGASRD